MQPYQIVIIVLIGVVVVLGLALVAFSGGNTRRIRLGLRSLGRALRNPEFADKVEPLLEPPPSASVAAARPSGAPLRLLALLQRQGRLVDFLLEDIQTYPDAQVGAAVRDIHRHCQAALREHLVLAPVLPQAEGVRVEVGADFDPSAIRLTGNVTGRPPFAGTLQHHGWRVQEMKVPAPPEGQDEFILMPAEVELS
jgi:hypothetical protein